MTVRLTLVDAAAGSPFAAVDVPADRLPETFAVATTLHLPDGAWTVEAAEPVTRDEAVARGALRLTLRRQLTVDPKTILFGLPTIENELPPSVPGEPGTGLQLHEDSWRQRELVSHAFSEAIEAELADIRTARTTARGAGFAELHVRRRIPAPLDGVRIALTELTALLGRPPGLLAIGSGVVDGGFAYPRQDGALYGRTSGGVVVALGAADGADVGVLAPLCRVHDLVSVDWCVPLVRRF